MDHPHPAVKKGLKESKQMITSYYHIPIDLRYSAQKMERRD
jgi:hypothetical protein